MDLIVFDFTLLLPFLVHLVIFILLRNKRRFMSEAFMLSLLAYEAFFIFVLWPSLPAFMAIMFLLIGVPAMVFVVHLVLLGLMAVVRAVGKKA